MSERYTQAYGVGVPHLLNLAWFFYTRHKNRVEMQRFRDSLGRQEAEARLRDFEAMRIADETKPPP